MADPGRSNSKWSKQCRFSAPAATGPSTSKRYNFPAPASTLVAEGILKESGGAMATMSHANVKKHFMIPVSTSATNKEGSRQVRQLSSAKDVGRVPLSANKDEEEQAPAANIKAEEITNHPTFKRWIRMDLEMRGIQPPDELKVQEGEDDGEKTQTSNPLLDKYLQKKCKDLEPAKMSVDGVFHDAATFGSSVKELVLNISNDSDRALLQLLKENDFHNHAKDLEEVINGNDSVWTEDDEYLAKNHAEVAVCGADLTEKEFFQLVQEAHGPDMGTHREEFLKKHKKGNLPRSATRILKAWWKSNIHNPYPKEDVKKRFQEQTGLEAHQINNWFINQRKRHWPPRRNKLPMSAPQGKLQSTLPAQAEEDFQEDCRAR